MLELTALQVDYSQDADTEQDSVWRQVAIPVEYSLEDGDELAVDLEPVAKVEVPNIKLTISTADLDPWEKPAEFEPIDDLLQADGTNSGENYVFLSLGHGSGAADPTTSTDDVVVDGRIITAENYDAAHSGNRAVNDSFGGILATGTKKAADIE